MAKQQKNNGIHLENSIRITSESSSSNRFLVMAAQWLVILAGICSLVFGLISGLELKPDYKLLFYGIVITAAIHIIIHEVKIANIYITIGYLILISYGIYKFFPFIENGFYCLENAFIEKAAPYYGFQKIHFIVEQDPQVSITALLIVFIQLIGFITAKEVYRHYLRSIYLLLAAVCYGVVLGVGKTPDIVWFLITICVIVAMRAMDCVPNAVRKEMPDKGIVNLQGSKRQRIRLKTAYISGLALIILVLFARLIISNHFYEALDMHTKKQNMQDMLMEFSLSDAVEELKERFKDIDLFGHDQSTGGGLDSGKLGQTGSVTFTNESALLVTVNVNTNFLYLKGYAGVEYTKDEWKDLSASDQSRFDQLQDEFAVRSYQPESLLFDYIDDYEKLTLNHSNGASGEYPFFDIKFSKGTVTVDYVNANKKFMYAPYLTGDLGNTSLGLVGDQYLKPESKTGSYQFGSVYQPVNNFTDLNQLISSCYLASGLQGYSSSDIYFNLYERAYRQLVYDVYTRLPEDGLERLRAIQLDVYGSGVEREISVIQEVIEYLRANTTYSLSPGKPDSDTDFAEYFLFDAKKGYCSHYATAATLLLRNYGVPARYVEGYVIPHDSIEAGIGAGVSIVNVTDKNAHAWVEVYLDKVGWIPIEVTNGYSEDGPEQILPEISNALQTQAPTPTATAVPTKAPTNTPTPTPTITVTKSPDTTPEATKTPSITDSPSLEPEGAESASSNHVFERIMKILCIVLLTIGLAAVILYLRYVLIKSYYNRGLQSDDMAQWILSYYRKVERILGDAHIVKNEQESYEQFAASAQQKMTSLPRGFDTITVLALKARFGKESISQQEVKQIKEYYREFRTRYLMEQKQIIRILLKYWKVL